MSSAKTERLVNLTMALLGTKRYMTKSEIFRRVAGYSGSSETKERMFERDKDDLRNLGIEIEVASHDPLFEDEVGYRIRPEMFQLQERFDAEELGLVALALNLVKDPELQNRRNSVLRRINSLSVSPQMPDELLLTDAEISELGLTELLDALGLRQTVEFQYLKEGSEASELRIVNPLGVSAWLGNWYLVGEDLNRDDVRVFKLSRIKSKIDVRGKEGSYVIPRDFDIKDYLIMYQPLEYVSLIKLRKGVAANLRDRSTSIEVLDDDWDQVEIAFKSKAEAKREILWFGCDAIVIEPQELRKEIIASLEKLVALHG
ncbi:MAG: helix-turn-helix transcriptional regulator [Candidatus Nanopelagicaceae bacterium]